MSPAAFPYWSHTNTTSLSLRFSSAIHYVKYLTQLQFSSYLGGDESFQADELPLGDASPPPKGGIAQTGTSLLDNALAQVSRPCTTLHHLSFRLLLVSTLPAASDGSTSPPYCQLLQLVVLDLASDCSDWTM